MSRSIAFTGEVIDRQVEIRKRVVIRAPILDAWKYYIDTPSGSTRRPRVNGHHSLS
jgi:hypothetical protein